MKNEFKEARKKYKPEKINYLLVAESPPNPDRFFYFEDVKEHDRLYLEIMKSIYDSELSEKELRKNKKGFLRRFQKDGFYLLDAVEEPIKDLGKREKRKRINKNLPSLIEKLHNLIPKDTKIILVTKTTVCEVCYDPLKSEDFDVIAKLPFPEPSSRKKFRRKLMCLYWKDKYEKEEDLYNTGLEEDLGKKFRENGFITKQDLRKIIKWKFHHLKVRQKSSLKGLKDVDKSTIKKNSKKAFKAENDEKRIKSLRETKQVGNSISSVILAFYDPEKYGILDRHSWRALFGEEPYDLYRNPNHLLKFLKELREISSEVNLSCRDVEKALFKKNKANPIQNLIGH